ncbi:MAG: hypothetical protein Q9160_008290 [Pyrenula sp. 1 TL-2023]
MSRSSNASEASEDNVALPTIVDMRALEQPDRLYGATTWIDDNGGLKLREITYRDMSDAVNRTAYLLQKVFGKSADFTSLAYAGPSDYRCNVVTMAAAKTGHKTLLLAPWNPKVAQLKILEECNCNFLLVAEDDMKSQRSAEEIAADRKLRLQPFPTLKWILNGPNTPMYHFNKSLKDLYGRDYVTIHTSGSTGYSVPITYKYNAIASLRYLGDPSKILPNGPSPNTKLWSSKTYWLALPACHMGGVLFTGALNIYLSMPMIFAPPDRPIDAQITAQMLAQNICDAAMIPPAYLQDLHRQPEGVEITRRLKQICWAGAPWTSTELADAVRSRTEIQAVYGSSEAGPIILVPETQDDYEWMHFHPIMGATMRHYSEDLYELVLVRDPDIVEAQFVFHNFPELSEWETRDLFSRHPTKTQLWKFRGRRDEIFVLANARNVEPGPMEKVVSGHAKVKAAILLGSGRRAAALLVEPVEPVEGEEARAVLVEEIWPTVRRGNEMINSYARVLKSMILVSRVEKPFLRAGKGSVQRWMTLNAYEDEIDYLYTEGSGKDVIMN